MRTALVTFVDGQITDGAGRLSVLDHGLLYGDGVFDTMVEWNGRMFKLEEHLDRLYASMAAIKLAPPYSRDEMRHHVLDTVRASRLSNAYVKCVVTRGGNGQPLMDPRGCAASCVMFVMPYVSKISDERRESGLRLHLASMRRVPSQALDARIKSLNYLNLVQAKMEAQAVGAHDALLLAVDGMVSEATGANLIVVRDRDVVSPSSDVLEGITRDTVLDLAARDGYRARVDVVTVDDLHAADELFLTSTAGGVLPVSYLDGRPVGQGCQGPVTELMHQRYQMLLEDPDHGTPVALERTAGRPGRVRT